MKKYKGLIAPKVDDEEMQGLFCGNSDCGNFDCLHLCENCLYSLQNLVKFKELLSWKG